MNQKYYVVTDPTDPGSEHDTYEEAAEVVRQMQREGYKEATILHPSLNTHTSDVHEIFY